MADDALVQYPVTADAYDVYSEIGAGAFATVYHGAVRGRGEEVAIKVIDLDAFNTNWDEIRREISTMSLLSHPCVVRILCSFVERAELWIIMPLLQAGSCAAVMKQLQPRGLKDEALLATVLSFTLQGLQYLHKDGRIHRDVKAGNILIGGAGEVQLADFGVAGTLMENGDRKKNRQTFTGTPCWMAPEVMEQAAGYDEKADIWSFGITALELAYGFAPYAKFQPMKVMLLTLQEEPPTADCYGPQAAAQFSRHFHSLVKHCLKKDSSKRPSARKLLEHKFFKLARGRDYIVDCIVRKLPARSRQPEQTISIVRRTTAEAAAGAAAAAGGGAGRGAAGGEQEGVGGVSVGSWVFDPEEFQELKRAVAAEEEKEGRRRPPAIPEREAEDDEDDYRNTPLHSPPLSPALQSPLAAAAQTIPFLPPALHSASASAPAASSFSSSSSQSFAAASSHTSPASAASLSASSSSSSSSSSLPAPQPPVSSRKQSHGRFVVTDHILDSAAAVAASGSPTAAARALPAADSSVSSAYAAIAAGQQPTSTLTHSRVGRFAVTDEQHH